MSSATSERERGQVLAFFALASVTLLLAAALAFDGGMVLLELRDEQNAADASAIAGARFLPDATSTATGRATAIAAENGFQDDVNDASVDITIGSWSPAGGFVAGGGTGAIEVVIAATRPSIFAGIAGIVGWDVSARAVAVNQDTTDGPFALLSLDPDACAGVLVEGAGVVTSNGNIQVNSACESGDNAFRIAGTGSLELQGDEIGCNIVGGWSTGGGVLQNDCNPPNLGADDIPDPYAWLPDPPTPGLPDDMTLVSNPGGGNENIPSGCPGAADEATAATPRLCQFGGSKAGQTWRVFPGYYPGGLDLGGVCIDGPDVGTDCDSVTDTWTTFLLEPGLYYVGGGGFRSANAGLVSVDTGGTTLGGGVLIFNSNHPDGTPLPRQLILQGGFAQVQLWPLVGTNELADYDRFVVYQDRDLPVVTPCADAGPGSTLCEVQILGGDSDMDVRGIIYAPSAHVRVEGNAGTLTLDQAIANTFSIKGGGGTINVAFDEDFLPTLQYAGLVE